MIFFGIIDRILVCVNSGFDVEWYGVFCFIFVVFIMIYNIYYREVFKIYIYILMKIIK